MAENVLQALARVLPTLSAAEARVAEAVLADPEGTAPLTITQLAQRCGTSQATVARFTQSLGYTGYRDFRIDLATASSREHVRRERFSVAGGPLADDATLDDVIASIGYREAMTIEETLRQIDREAVETAATALAASSRIDIVGSGSSGIVATDMHQKLHRIGLPVNHFSDQHLALSSVALQSPGGVAVCISHSGQTRDVLDALEVAGRAGGMTVGITGDPESELARSCDIALVTHAREDEYRSAAMSSRMAQLAVIDILFVRVVQRNYARVAEPLRLTYDAVQSRRAPHARRRRGHDAST